MRRLRQGLAGICRRLAHLCLALAQWLDPIVTPEGAGRHTAVVLQQLLAESGEFLTGFGAEMRKQREAREREQ